MTTTYAWHPSWPAPAGIPVRQVYAWIVDDRGRVLLIEMPGAWNLPGGTPEDTDADWQATVRREALEEADVTLRDLVPLGFQLVSEDQQASIAQLRVVARVDEWLEQTPDPDNGIVYRRAWVPLAAAGQRLRWGRPVRPRQPLSPRSRTRSTAWAPTSSWPGGPGAWTAPWSSRCSGGESRPSGPPDTPTPSSTPVRSPPHAVSAAPSPVSESSTRQCRGRLAEQVTRAVCSFCRALPAASGSWSSDLRPPRRVCAGAPSDPDDASRHAALPSASPGTADRYQVTGKVTSPRER